MYWIFLLIFSFIVFVPGMVRQSYFSLSLVQVQEYVILFFGILAYSLFYIQEKKLRKIKSEKNRIQGEINRMTKDLTSSYSYIGEINRKLDILKKMVMQYPELTFLKASHEKDLYKSVIEAIQVLTKTSNVILRFLDGDGNILKEISKNKKLSAAASKIKHEKIKMSVYETDSHVIINSPCNQENISACILISKQDNFRTIEDPEIFKSMASHALFLYMFNEKKKERKID